MGVETARNVQTGGLDDADDAEDGDLLGAQEIDGHWLQRRITDTYSSAGTPIDAAVSQGLANDVFGILEVSSSATLSPSSSAASQTHRGSLWNLELRSLVQ